MTLINRYMPHAQLGNITKAVTFPVISNLGVFGCFQNYLLVRIRPGVIWTCQVTIRPRLLTTTFWKTTVITDPFFLKIPAGFIIASVLSPLFLWLQFASSVWSLQFGWPSHTDSGSRHWPPSHMNSSLLQLSEETEKILGWKWKWMWVCTNITEDPKLFQAMAPQTALASGRSPLLKIHRQCYKIYKETLTFRFYFLTFIHYSIMITYIYRNAPHIF